MTGKNASGKIALGGIIVALCVACMALSLIPAASLAMPAMAGVLLVPLVVEAGAATAFSAYAVTAVLSGIFIGNIEAVIIFIFFFGFYPILKSILEKLFGKGKRRILEWILKLGIFNGGVIAAYSVLIFVFKLPADNFSVGGVNIPWLVLAAGNGVFLLYDLALTRFVTGYIRALHPKISKMFKL